MTGETTARIRREEPVDVSAELLLLVPSRRQLEIVGDFRFNPSRRY